MHIPLQKAVHHPIQKQTFTSRPVRDLAWVISSPPLVSGEINDVHWWSHEGCQSEFNDCLPALIQLDKNPQPLIDFLNKLKTARLGLRFEALIAYWLTISPNYTLLSKNIQIIEDGLTLGEIDFIIEELNSQKIIHLEVAVKFYLGTPPYEDDYRWFGTNTKDQLGRKLDHLKQHQTQLSKKNKDHFNHEINERHCFIKGRLFYPVGISSPPDGVAENHLRGTWDYFKSSAPSTGNLIQSSNIPISKSDWLAKLNHTDIIQRQKMPEKYSNDRTQCFVKTNNIDDSDPVPNYKEETRIFFIPENFTFPSNDTD